MLVDKVCLELRLAVQVAVQISHCERLEIQNRLIRHQAAANQLGGFPLTYAVMRNKVVRH